MASADTHPVHDEVNTPGVTDQDRPGGEAGGLFGGLLNGVPGSEDKPGHHDGTGDEHGQFQTF